MGYGILTTPEKAHRETSSSSPQSASEEFFEKPVISRQEKSSNPLKLQAGKSWLWCTQPTTFCGAT